VGKNLALQLVDTTLVVVHNARQPNDDDWALFMLTWGERWDTIAAQLVVTDGGGPNATQRRKALALLTSRQGGHPQTAVVTSSIMARGVVTAMSWFIKDRIRAFPQRQLAEACTFLGVSHRYAELREVVRNLRRELELDEAAAS
jgi:hypothetical protein